MGPQRISAGCARVSASRAADHPGRGAGTGMVTTVTVTIPVAIEVVGTLCAAARAQPPENAVTISTWVLSSAELLQIQERR
jgi:hypothetical protein